ncbi:hypothetical protein [Archangium primigenium]|uniref:hypothetical protein n=1 Tax=[Archangium] primigenium TaxID=2792470 RepID=UPI00195BCF75|nr:hypothetical protein [Archangium primigenium]MBM7113352.1 hypothetical protein [Archangium primigenium]
MNRIAFLVLASIAGGLLVFLALILFWGGVATLAALLAWWRPARPTCRQGGCRAKDYALVGSPEQTQVDRERWDRWLPERRGRLVRCRCGDHYLRDARHRRFLWVDAQGTPHPYRYHRPLGREWLPDHDS